MAMWGSSDKSAPLLLPSLWLSRSRLRLPNWGILGPNWPQLVETSRSLQPDHLATCTLNQTPFNNYVKILSTTTPTPSSNYANQDVQDCPTVGNDVRSD